MAIKIENILNGFLKVLKITAYFISALLCLIISISILDHYNVWSKHSIFNGISYLPPVWLFLPIILLAVFLFFVKKKLVALSILAFYLLYFALFGDISFSLLWPDRNENYINKRLSVLALNVRYYSYDASKVLNFIDSVDADIVLLSENTLCADSIKAISRLGEKYEFCVGKKFETAVFSKFPIVESREVEFPTKQASLSGSNHIDSLHKNPNRSFTHVKVNHHDKLINVISVRFIAGRPKTKKLSDQIAWGNYLVRKQTEETQFFINYLKKLKEPVIFGGDLNAPPNAKIMDELYDIANDAAHARSIIPLPTFRTEVPVMRLDYIFASEEFLIKSYERLRIEVSDHFPILAEIGF